MLPISDAILQALAPGIALNSAIFYCTSLQNRFLYITARARDLNKEARELEGNPRRLDSVRRQVDSMTKRARAIKRVIVLVYCALCCFILTILGLLASALMTVPGGGAPALAVFALGFVLLATSTLISMGEMALSQRTLDEDIRSSFPEPDPAGPCG
jgi:hypothetical protein